MCTWIYPTLYLYHAITGQEDAVASLKVSKVAQMNGGSRRCSYVNVYPISDSSEAVGHLILSVLAPPTVPAHQFKSSLTSSRVSSRSHHILIFEASRNRLELSWVIQQNKKKTGGDRKRRKMMMMKQRFGAMAGQPNRAASWLSGEAWTIELILKAAHWSEAWLPVSS